MRERKRYQQITKNDVKIHQKRIQKTMKNYRIFLGHKNKQDWPMERPMVEKVLRANENLARFADEVSLLMN